MLSPSAHPSGFIEPCLPTLSRTVPDGPRWAFEVKHDGYRFIARRDGDRVRVFSRHGKDWTDKVPAIVEAMLALPVKTAILDGDGETIFRHACGFGAEGIVAKRRDRPYRSGRSPLRLGVFPWVASPDFFVGSWCYGLHASPRGIHLRLSRRLPCGPADFRPSASPGIARGIDWILEDNPVWVMRT